MALPSSENSKYDTPLEPFVVNGPMSLSQFVQTMEEEHKQSVRMLHAGKHRGYLLMPVELPNPNGDRFSGQGHVLMEDLVCQLKGKTRNATHGIIIFYVLYENSELYNVKYNF
ncbi:hypothetical protein niasHT_024571 [Heterodera trifolii]|uniref:Uncharacterized protein n=1 Tax=Heterodera trifolii TaxID=157864 RepID=A0ABD2K7H9_9BILA